MKTTSRRTGDARPRKSQNNKWVLRVKWRQQEVCGVCHETLSDHCESADMELPDNSDADQEFLVPYGWLELKCFHTGSPHLDESIVVSSYEGLH